MTQPPSPRHPGPPPTIGAPAPFRERRAAYRRVEDRAAHQEKVLLARSLDILQQTSALRAAVDSLSVLVLEDHVQGCVRTAAERGEADRYVDEVIDVVRRTLGRPIRGAARPG